MNRCPICNQAVSQSLFTLNASRAAKLIYGNNRKKKLNQLSACISRIWGQSDCTVKRCKSCYFVFADPFNAGNGEFYNLTYGENFSYPEWKWDYEVTVQSIKSIKNDFSALSVLEIGAGNGFFLDHLLNLGVQKENMYANELSSGGCQELKRKGYTTFQHDLSELRPTLIRRKADIICMFQVLEHLDNLHIVFDVFNNISSDDAILYISVPNYHTRSLFDRFFLHFDVPPMHIGRYSRQALAELGAIHGWKIKDFRLQQQPYIEKIKKLLFAVYERSSMKSIPYKIKNKMFSYLVKKLVYTGIGIRYLPLLVLLKSGKYGTSQWVQFNRIKTSDYRTGR